MHLAPQRQLERDRRTLHTDGFDHRGGERRCRGSGDFTGGGKTRRVTTLLQASVSQDLSLGMTGPSSLLPRGARNVKARAPPSSSCSRRAEPSSGTFSLPITDQAQQKSRHVCLKLLQLNYVPLPANVPDRTPLYASVVAQRRGASET